MPLPEGRSRADRLRDPVRLPLDQIVRWMVQICAGATHMHAHGWFHRDFKAANLFIQSPEDGAIIPDLGVIREAAAPSSHSPQGILHGALATVAVSAATTWPRTLPSLVKI